MTAWSAGGFKTSHICWHLKVSSTQLRPYVCQHPVLGCLDHCNFSAATGPNLWLEPPCGMIIPGIGKTKQTEPTRYIQQPCDKTWQDLMARSNYALLIAGISEEASDLETAPGNSWVKSMPQWPSKSDNFLRRVLPNLEFGDVQFWPILLFKPIIGASGFRIDMSGNRFTRTFQWNPASGIIFFRCLWLRWHFYSLHLEGGARECSRYFISNRFWHSVSDAWTPHVSSLMIYNSLSTTGSEAHLMRFQSHYAKMNCNVVWCQCNVMSNIMWRVHIYIYIYTLVGVGWSREVRSSCVKLRKKCILLWEHDDFSCLYCF